MNITTFTLQVVLGILTGAALLASAGEPEFEISRSTIDGGGVMNSTGGAFELSGTIGQPDAGLMTGGAFGLSGGFWFRLAPTDCNDDGLVDFLDYETYTVCLLGPGGGIGASACPCYDVDRDGDITLGDYATLQAGFTVQ